MTSSSSPCSNKRRRGFHTAITRSGRQRHCLQADCCITMGGGPAIFDQVPWISAMDSLAQNPWDIADLSQLPVEKSRPAGTGAGPIRRRKTSLRSEPFPTDLMATPELSPSLSIDSPLSYLSPPLPQRVLFEDAVPKTPPRRTQDLPLGVHFRNLMPVPLSALDNEDDW